MRKIILVLSVLFPAFAFAAENPVIKLKVELSARELSKGKERKYTPKKEVASVELPTCVDDECLVRSGHYYFDFGSKFDEPHFTFTLYAVQTTAKDGKVSTYIELGLMPELQPNEQTLYSTTNVEFAGAQLTGAYSVSFQQKVDGTLLIPTGTINPL